MGQREQREKEVKHACPGSRWDQEVLWDPARQSYGEGRGAQAEVEVGTDKAGQNLNHARNYGEAAAWELVKTAEIN